jgi:alpha-galactosidase
MWIDLEVFPGGIANLRSGMKSSVALNDNAHTWSAELAIPIKAITADFDPESEWRVNFYRVEGRQEPRSYLAWQPTGTPEPNFHVPSAFGRMKFQL